MRVDFVIVGFVTALLLLLPLPWHWRARNVATLSLIAWLFIMNFLRAVNAIVWAGNVNIVAMPYCDLYAKLVIGCNIALSAATLCVVIHLERLASVRSVSTSRADKRKRMIFEICMCWVLPLIIMALHYIVQGHRYDILEDFGCAPTTYISWPAMLIVWVPPLVLTIPTIIYAALALRHFIIRRAIFTKVLQNSDSGLTTTRYLRLILMASTELVLGAVFSSYTLWYSSHLFQPWTTWANVHSHWNRVDRFPLRLVPAVTIRQQIAMWYFLPIASWTFIAFFAFGAEAFKEYAEWVRWVRVRVLRQKIDPERNQGPMFSFGSVAVRPGAPAVSIPELPTISVASHDGANIARPLPSEYKSEADGIDAPAYLSNPKDDLESSSAVSSDSRSNTYTGHTDAQSIGEVARAGDEKFA